MADTAGQEQWYAPAGELSGAQMLCFTVPLRRGDRVALVGTSPELVSTTRALGLEPVPVTAAELRPARAGHPWVAPSADDGVLPLGDAAVDHVILPRLTTTLRPLFPHELARVLRPGGGLLLGAPWRARAPRDGAAVSVRRTLRALHQAGFEEVTAYAVRPGLHRPRHLVPLGSPEAARWYVACAYQPLGWRGALVCRLFTAWGAGRAPLVLFPAVGFTARRSGERQA